MTNNLVPSGGFDAFEPDFEDDGGGTSSLIAGTRRIKFTNDFRWVFADSNQPLPPDLELIVADIKRELVRFGGENGKQLLEQRVLEPGEKFGVDELNDRVPKNEWRSSFGKLTGPWQAQHVVFLVDERTLDRYTFCAPTSTVGSTLGVKDIADKMKFMRRWRGNVLPVIKLGDTFMKTSFGGAAGGRQRPHLIVQRWIRMDSNAPALPASMPSRLTSAPTLTPEQSAKENQAVAAAPNTFTPAAETKTVATSDLKTVTEPSLSKEMDDGIPY